MKGVGTDFTNSIKKSETIVIKQISKELIVDEVINNETLKVVVVETD